MYIPNTQKYTKLIFHHCECGLLLQDLFSWCYLAPLATVKDSVVVGKFNHFSPTHQWVFEKCCRRLYLPVNVCKKNFFAANLLRSAKAEVADLQQFIASQRTKLLGYCIRDLCIPRSDFSMRLVMFSMNLNPCCPQQSARLRLVLLPSVHSSPAVLCSGHGLKSDDTSFCPSVLTHR